MNPRSNAFVVALSVTALGCSSASAPDEVMDDDVVASSVQALTPPTAPATDCSVYPERRVFLETQSWWQESGDEEAHHLHMGTCFPLMEEISGIVSFNVRVMMHHRPGKVSSMGVQIFGNGPSSYAKVPIDFDCQNEDCSVEFRVSVDTAKAAYDGRWEWRFLTHIPDTNDPGTDKEFTTTRWHAILRNGKPSKDGPNVDRTPGAAGWYQGLEYENVFVRNAEAMPFVREPQRGVVTLYVKADGSVRAPNRLIVAADPAFHASPPNPGLVNFSGAATGAYQAVTVDTTRLTNGPHKLHLRAETDFASASATGVGTGVLVLPFTVQNGP
jgi:hypothetical protein